jgi:RES domain-containing protein
MHVYRIAKTAFINDLSGMGAKIYGGRWNKKGTALIYASENRSLAFLELLVHLPLSLMPKELSIATIHIPDKI